MNEIRSRIQKIAKLVDMELPIGYGFFVICFPFGVKGRVEYASNAKREDVIKAMKKFIELNPMQKPERN